ncbi:hypothetical protein FQA39_LY02848 [Lamprigera yunnana]|nr:hypothetical protein FQA39_LY02848 [Lamprigera yunnana]
MKTEYPEAKRVNLKSTTAASEVVTDKLETTAKNNKAAVKERDDNDIKKERRADFNDEELLDNENDANVDKTREEEPEQSIAAVDEDSLAETGNDEVGKEDGIPEGKAGELEKQVSEILHQVLPTVQCDFMANLK